MKKILITAFALSLAVPALAAQQDIAQISAVTASREALRTAVNTQLSAVQANFDEVYAAFDAGPVYVNASTPADTKVVWIDTDQDNAIKVYVGGVWTVVGSGGEGSYTLPTASADTLGGVKVGARLTITDGVLSADVQAGGESTTVGDGTTGPYLDGTVDGGTLIKLSAPSGGNGTWTSLQGGNPTANRNWRLPIDAPPAAGTTRLINVDENTQMGLVDPATFLTPTGSGSSLTGSFTGTLIGSQTTLSGAIQTIGTELDGQDELLFGSEFTETAGAGTVTVTLDYPVTSETYGSSWSADTDGTMRKDIYAILRVGDTDDDGMVDKLDLASAGFVKVNDSGVISSVKEKEYIGWSVVNSDTATAVADGKLGAAIPAGMNGMNLTDVTCSVAALNAAASGATTAVVRRVRLGSRMGDDTSQFDLTFSTPNVTVTWDSTGTDPGISTSTLAAGDEVDISGFATAANNGHFTVATVGANYFTFANASGVENLDDVGVTITPIRHRDMTSTGVTIGYNEYTASDEVIDTSNDDLATGDNLYVDVNAVTTAAQKGLHCTATFEAP